MSTIRLGGVKVIENRAYLCSSCRSGDALGSICSVLAAGRVNWPADVYGRHRAG